MDLRVPKKQSGSHQWLPFPPLAGAALQDGAGRVARSPERFINRDLSWLNFNDRVLAEAADPTVPALERLRFATIVSSNLDEFFMVRVAEIARWTRRFPLRRFPDGLTAGQALAQIRDHVLRQKARQAVVIKEILASLDDAGIRVYADFARGHTSIDREIESRLPAIRYVLRRSTEPLPTLMSEQIQIFVRFPGEYAVLTIQEREARLIELPARGRRKRYALAERWLAGRAADFFTGREVIEAFPFKIIRGADLRYRPDDEDTLEEQIAEAVERRSKAQAVRLEVDAPSYSEGALFLATSLGLDSAGLYRFDLPLDLRTLARLHGLPQSGRLRYVPVRPQSPIPLSRTPRYHEVLDRRDVLLHHPYDSFAPVVRFLASAATDPDVTRIYHTIYRTSRDSPILVSLKEAARRGKKVTVYVEIKARFDELNNLRWAEELRKDGVRVVRPLGGLKVHSKVSQVVRVENGVERFYTHLGTGNYHPGTALQYTDLGLLTADQEIGRDVQMFFEALRRRRLRAGARFSQLLVAPQNLHPQILKLIRRETQLQRSGERGHIVAKMNSLVDADIIEALYEASQAGVRVELLVRGICCLRPGVKGLSESIRVVSVIDRFLEHSRIYYFRCGGRNLLYLSSADWMPRNFYTRFEIAFPIKDIALQQFVRGVILHLGLSDNIKAWTLKPDGGYGRVAPRGGVAVRSQSVLADLAARRYRGTSLEHRIGL